jgi:hypothetical protein
MADDTGLKSAYELAMERLKRRDAEAGIESRPVTDAQKAAIAEARSFYEAKLAEAQVLHESSMRQLVDPAARDTLEQGYRRERERLNAERDRKVEQIRSSL